MDALLRRRVMIAAGGGSPVPPTPTGVVFYDKLVFDGTAHIQTDIFIPEDGVIRVTCGGETVKAAQGLFRQLGSGGSSVIAVWYGSATTTTTRKIACRYRTTTSSTTHDLAFGSTRLSLFLTPYYLGWGTAKYSITKGTETPALGLDIGTADANAFSGFMEAYRVYGDDAKNATSASELINNYTPVYTLQPCTYNGEPGLWCIETSTFYGNTAGAGQLSVMNNE